MLDAGSRLARTTGRKSVWLRKNQSRGRGQKEAQEETSDRIRGSFARPGGYLGHLAGEWLGLVLDQSVLGRSSISIGRTRITRLINQNSETQFDLVWGRRRNQSIFLAREGGALAVVLELISISITRSHQSRPERRARIKAE